MFRSGIDGSDGTIREAHIRMRHHSLRTAGREKIAKGHAHCRILMRHYNRLGQMEPLSFCFSKAFDDRREVRPGIGKDIIDAYRFQPGQDRASRRYLVPAESIPHFEILVFSRAVRRKL
jgi:hypothetical protein